MIKAIIFDFYGVIRSDEYHDWLGRHGLNREQGFREAVSNMDSGKTSIDEFFSNLSILSGLDAKEIKEEFSSQARLNQQLVELIINLKKNYKIALVSNASSTHLRDTMEKAGIFNLFNEIVISAELGFIKPSSEIFHYALSKLAINPNEAVFIDDNQNFIDAAKQLGLEGICYSDVPKLKQDLAKLGVKIKHN